MKIQLIDGVVTKDGEELGRYDAATNTLHCPKRISPALYTPIREAIGKKPEYDFGAPNSASPAADMVSSEKPEPEVVGSVPPHETSAAETLKQGASEAGEPHTLDLEGSTPSPATTHEEESATVIRPATVTPTVAPPSPLPDDAPPQDWDKGDKTPAFVLWFCRTNPAEAVKRYANRKLAPELLEAIEEAVAKL